VAPNAERALRANRSAALRVLFKAKRDAEIEVPNDSRSVVRQPF
jgi:hypothetical protein